MKVNRHNLAVILVNWNQYDLTRACIISLLECTYQDFEIFLVDNDSNDNSVLKLKKEFEKVNYIQNSRNLGFTGANNIGIKNALNRDFGFIMLLNNDTEVESDFIEPLLSSFKSNVQLGAVQPLILNYHSKETVWNFGGTFNSFFGLVQTLNKGVRRSELKENYLTDWISGCCFMFKANIASEIGLLDDFFFVYFEDVDYSLRIKKAGFELGLQEKSVIYHHEGASFKGKIKKIEGTVSPYTHYLRLRNHLYFNSKYNAEFNFFGKWIYQIFQIFSYILYFTIRLRFNKLKMIYKGLIDGMKSI